MVDERIGDDPEHESKDALTPTNNKEKQRHGRQTAVAITNKAHPSEIGDEAARLAPRITASGYGKIAEQILDLAFENDIKVREDKDLAGLLAHLDQDTPIPPEALEAIAEILSYVYRANGQPNPFEATLKDAMQEDDENEDPTQ